jgi:crotonobetainyl-CoA:carnitine CoA-transferase CaiB-like acyl-CoA transferase
VEHEGALSGVRVLDLGQFLSAPRCGQILAEHGADVVKIEPGQGETLRLLVTVAGAERVLSCINTNKRGLRLDLRSPAGRELFLELVKAADVLLENFTPGTMERMGLGYDSLAEANPRLVYASITGYGQTGPLRDRPAFDIIAQASSGIMDALGLAQRPPPIFFADLVSGAYAALGVVMALFARARTGRGQRVDVSMQDVMYAHHFRAHSHRALGEHEARATAVLGRSIDNLMTDPDNPLPFWNSYLAADGFVAVVALTDSQWRRLMQAVGRDDLNADPRFANFVTRVRNAAAGIEALSGWMAARTAAEAVDALTAARVPCARVCPTSEVNADPQLAAREMLASVEHPRLGRIDVPGTAIKLSATPGRVARPHPDLGGHTREVLAELLGMGDDELARWKERGAF